MLKLDGNPLEYPPKEILQLDPATTTMDAWLQRLKEFLVQSKRGWFAYDSYDYPFMTNILRVPRGATRAGIHDVGSWWR